MSLERVTAFPLAWPVGWKRVPAGDRVAGKFGKVEREYIGENSYARSRPITVSVAAARVLREIVRFGCPESDAVISSNVQLRLDGLPRSGQAAVQDPGVAVYWRDGAETRCIAVDRYRTPQDNLAAIAATLEAMRAIERHGGAEILTRAFAGFAALPAPGATSSRGWREVLEVGPLENDLEAVKRQYRVLSGRRHPDRPGGSSAAMSELNWAWSQAQETLERRTS